MTITITLKEFKDAGAAVNAMANPGADAFCLDSAALKVLESAKNVNAYSYGGYDDYQSDYDDYGGNDSSDYDIPDSGHVYTFD